MQVTVCVLPVLGFPETIPWRVSSSSSDRAHSSVLKWVAAFSKSISSSSRTLAGMFGADEAIEA